MGLGALPAPHDGPGARALAGSRGDAGARSRRRAVAGCRPGARDPSAYGLNDRAGPAAGDRRSRQPRRLRPRLFLLYYFASRDGHALNFHSLLTTPAGELRRWATLAALATLYLFPLIVFRTITVSSWWTAPTILVLALSQWCVFLSFASYLWERFRLPVSALLETREGRGVAAERPARRLFDYRCWTHLALRVEAGGVTLTLGWCLSANAADELDRQLKLATATPMAPTPRSACRTRSP